MLVIRLQRTGRKGHAMFRVVVQDSRRTPSSGKIVANLGNYDPHNKTVVLDKEKAKFYLDHGAQPSDRVAVILKSENVKLPDWVKQSAKKEGSVRNPDKRRSTAPEDAADDAAESTAEEKTESAPEEPPAESSEPTAEAEESGSENADVEPEAKADAPTDEDSATEAAK